MVLTRLNPSPQSESVPPVETSWRRPWFCGNSAKVTSRGCLVKILCEYQCHTKLGSGSGSGQEISPESKILFWACDSWFFSHFWARIQSTPIFNFSHFGPLLITNWTTHSAIVIQNYPSALFINSCLVSKTDGLQLANLQNTSSVGIIFGTGKTFCRVSVSFRHRANELSCLQNPPALCAWYDQLSNAIANAQN